MASTPIKYNSIDSDGKPQLQEFSTTEENYLAYQAGLRLSVAGNTDNGSLNTDSSTTNQNTVGTYTDTKFNQAVGTHGTTLTTQTTNTVLYQKHVGPASAENGANGFRKPIHYQKTGSQTEFHEMTSSEMDTLVDRLTSTIFTNDYVGTYKLATSAPTGYTVKLSNVFTDTRTDGTSINYSIYRRTSMTAPTTKKPLFVKRASGHTGSFQGLQQMTDAQMQYTFGQRAKNRIGRTDDLHVGNYLLLSGTQGTPTQNGHAGTWVSKGTATDTKNTTAGTAYTRTSSRDYLGNYTRLRASTYSRTRSSNYSRSFTGNYARNFAGNYAGNYARTRTENYSRAFAGNYVGGLVRSSNYTGNYTRNFEGTRSSNYVGNYARGFSRNYTRNITDSYTGDYSRNYNRSFTRNFAGNFTGNYTGTKHYTRNYVGNYTGTTQYSDTYAPNGYYQSAQYEWRISPEPSGPTTLVWTTQVWYAGTQVYSTTDTEALTAFLRTAVTTGGKTYNRGTMQPYNPNTSTTFRYAVYRSSGADTNFTRTLSGFTGEYVGNYLGGTGAYGTEQWTGQTSGGTDYYWAEQQDFYGGSNVLILTQWNGTFVGGGPQSYTTGSQNPPAVPDYESGGYGYNRGTYKMYLQNNKFAPGIWYFAIKRRVLSVSYTRTSTRLRTSNYSRTADWSRTSTRSRSSAYVRSFARAFTRISTRLRSSNYSRQFTRNYTRTSTRNVAENYAREYTRTSTRDFSGETDYVGNYSRNYSRSFTANYTRTSTRARVSTYTRNRASTYTRNFTGNYSRNITDAYTRTSSRDFLGNYTSDEIQSGNETIETYTLYVRTA